MSDILAFIGGGNMARSLIGGLIDDGHPADAILVSEPNPEAASALRDTLGVQTMSDNRAAVASADVLLLAIKPQVLAGVCAEIAGEVREHRPLVISIAAGIRADSIDDWLGGQTALVRCMPNTPAMVKAGMTGLYANPGVSAAQRRRAETILRAVGETLWVENEELLDAVTAVSGSGPAYYFLFMEAMIEAGEALGLDPDAARKLTLQTALGAASMAIGSDESPATLRRRVTSPGGTTEQAIHRFEAAGLREIVSEALRAARDRSIELSAQLGAPGNARDLKK